jgi:hypothetical protein
MPTEWNEVEREYRKPLSRLFRQSRIYCCEVSVMQGMVAEGAQHRDLRPSHTWSPMNAVRGLEDSDAV